MDDGALRALVAAALAEDVGAGDATARALIPADARAHAVIRTRADGVLSGLRPAMLAFHLVDERVDVSPIHRDGDRLVAGENVLHLRGPARGIVTAERVALNFLQRLSGVATLTRRYVDAVAGTGAAILDTRKTTPGLRALEKAAVRDGGGVNHRMGLDDMVLVKENHLRVAGSVAEAARRVRAAAPGLPVEVETTTLAEACDAVDAGIERVMLDNVPLHALRERIDAIRAHAARTGRRCPRLEVSGGVRLDTVRAIAECGPDDISVGALTHSAPALDLTLLVEEERTA